MRFLNFVLFLAAVQLSIKSNGATLVCNGVKELCDLRIDQVTFPGSHNAGSGFDGILRYWSGFPASSCWYRNHGKSFTDQLKFGIRYFDIDTCYGNGEALNCHNNAYEGSIKKGLVQIDNWLKDNPNDVVLIHFNRDAQQGCRRDIAKSVEKSLLELWYSNESHVNMSDYYGNFKKWPTLKEAVTSKKRVFIFMDNNLAQYLTKFKWFVKSNYFISSTWKTMGVSSSCSDITTNAKDKCDNTRTFQELAAFASYGLCTWDMAKLCSRWLGEAQEACYEKRKSHGKTVNFLLVDWVDYYSRKESVINKAKYMNQKNIKDYLGKSVTLIRPEVGCAYHAWWFYNYCWQDCPTGGWCWVNQYCGSNPDICKKGSYQCYSSCG